MRHASEFQIELLAEFEVSSVGASLTVPPMGGCAASSLAWAWAALERVNEARALKVAASNMLRIVRAERDGRMIRYVVDMTGFRDLLAYLMEDCCNGKPELCQPVIKAVTCDCQRRMP